MTYYVNGDIIAIFTSVNVLPLVAQATACFGVLWREGGVWMNYFGFAGTISRCNFIPGIGLYFMLGDGSSTKFFLNTMNFAVGSQEMCTIVMAQKGDAVSGIGEKDGEVVTIKTITLQHDNKEVDTGLREV